MLLRTASCWVRSERGGLVVLFAFRARPGMFVSKRARVWPATAGGRMPRAEGAKGQERPKHEMRTEAVPGSQGIGWAAISSHPVLPWHAECCDGRV